jgi:para-aminobenzoate synthetase component II
MTVRPVRVVVVDNRDSFVYNLVHYLRELGAEVEVRGNVTFPPEEVYDPRRIGADGVMISPGPGRPEDAGSSVEIIHGCARTGLPLLGVCLGHQAIAIAYGGLVGAAPELVHGATSEIFHEGAGVLHGLPQPFPATRYHSLSVDPGHIPDELEVTARTEDGTVMGLRHRDLALEGVQFHPESVLSEGGHELLANWLRTCSAA